MDDVNEYLLDKIKEKYLVKEIMSLKRQLEWCDKINFFDNDWDLISRYITLSEEFMDLYEDKINWNMVSKFQRLSEDFIRKYQDRLNWTYISTYQKLSEKFIIEFRYKVNWRFVYMNQTKLKMIY